MSFRVGASRYNCALRGVRLAVAEALMTDPQGESGAGGGGRYRTEPSQPVPAIPILAAAVGSFDQMPSWGPPAFVSSFAMLFLLLYWRACWSRASYWAAVILMAAAQVPFVIFARAIIQRNQLYILILMIADSLVGIVVTTLIAQLDPKSPINAHNYRSKRR